MGCVIGGIHYGLRVVFCLRQFTACRYDHYARLPTCIAWKEYIYSTCFYHHQIGSIHLSRCYHIFPWLCAWFVCYIILCNLLHMHSGKTGILFSLSLSSLWWVQIVRYVLACRTYSFAHYTILLSSLCKLMWRHWTYNIYARQIYFVECVRLSILSQLTITHYMGLCVVS